MGRVSWEGSGEGESSGCMWGRVSEEDKRNG